MTSSAQDDDHGHAIALRWNTQSAQFDAAAPQPGSHTTLTLTLTGNATFGDALAPEVRVGIREINAASGLEMERVMAI